MVESRISCVGAGWYFLTYSYSPYCTLCLGVSCFALQRGLALYRDLFKVRRLQLALSIHRLFVRSKLLQVILFTAKRIVWRGQALYKGLFKVRRLQFAPSMHTVFRRSRLLQVIRFSAKRIVWRGPALYNGLFKVRRL